MSRRFFPSGFPPAEPAPSGSWGRAFLLASGLALLTVCLYWPAVDFRLLSFDDYYYTQNDLIQGGLSRANIVRIFTELPDENLFIPLSQLSYMVDVELFGNAPRGFHLTNILLFAIDMALLLLVLWRATGSLGASSLAAALVAFHPLRVEAVAWVTERKGVLSVLFLLLSLACYLRYARTRKWSWYGALVAVTALGLLAKPMLVTLPFLLLLLDFWPLGRFRPQAGESDPPATGRRVISLAAEKVPLAALSVLASLATVHLQQKMSLHPGVTLISRVEHALSAVFFYLYQTVWPVSLPFRYFDTPWGLFSGTLLPAAAGFAVLTALVARCAGARPYLAFGWGWYLVSLFPVSGIVPTGIQWVSDRFTFVPHVGLAVAFAWLAGGFLARRPRWAFPALALLLLLPLAILSRRQLAFWKDGAALFGRGLASNAQDPRYIAQYAAELAHVGELSRAREQLERISRFAGDPEVGINIQLSHLSILNRLGDREGAIAQARRYLGADPRFWRTRLQLADDLYARGRYNEAAEEYRQVKDVGRIPSFDRGYALEGLALSLSRTGKGDEALAFYGEGLRENPGSVSLHYNLARLLADRGETGSAREHFEEALRISPGNVRVRMALAEELLRAGAADAAASHFQEVARVAPGTAEALLAGGRALEAAGMKAQARSMYRSALEAPAVFPETPDAVRRRLEKLP